MIILTYIHIQIITIQLKIRERRRSNDNIKFLTTRENTVRDKSEGIEKKMLDNNIKYIQ